MSREVKGKAVIKGVKKNAKDLFDKFDKSREMVVQAIDQNSDGKLDFTDLSIAAGSAMDNVKKGADKTAREIERNILNPISAEKLTDVSFHLSKLIRVTERDKRYIESEVCQNSVGYLSSPKNFRLINIFDDSIEDFGITLFPQSSYEFYYVDPSDRDQYIALDSYFQTLKERRVHELERVAQVLGAKHFKVTYKEEQKKTDNVKYKGKGRAKNVKAEMEHVTEEKTFDSIHLESESYYEGHDPERPELNYLKNDSAVNALIDSRLDTRGPLKQRTYMIKLSNSSGITEKDAVKIDSILKSLKASVEGKLTREAKKDSVAYLDFEVEF